MLKNIDKPKAFTMKIPSSLTKVANALSEMSRFLESFHLDESFLAKSRVVLRELLANAIQHSNYSQVEQTISIDAEFIEYHCLRISVNDSGDGFDHRLYGLNKPIAANGMKGRGSYLVRTLTDKMEFNQLGNCITVYISLSAIEDIG
jgi:anti-sigma regulatory factor (Ser/Thr protein kinase)